MSKPKIYTIKAGKQVMENRVPGLFVGKSMRRRIKFNESAKYTSIDPVNQFDCNKIFGFTDGFLTKYDGKKKKYRFANSARFGWDYRNDVLRLYAYVYVNGERHIKEMGPILLDKPYECCITPIGEEYVFTMKPLKPDPTEILGTALTMPRGARAKTVWGFYLFFFFGGNELAPHDFTVKMERL